MFLAAVIVLAKFQTALISAIDWHKPSHIPQNAELHSTCINARFGPIGMSRFADSSIVAILLATFSTVFSSTVHTGWKGRISVLLWVGSKTSTISDYKMDRQTALLVPTFHSFQWVCTQMWRTSTPAAYLVLWASPLPCVEVGWLKRLLHTPIFSVAAFTADRKWHHITVLRHQELTTVHLHYSLLHSLDSFSA